MRGGKTARALFRAGRRDEAEAETGEFSKLAPSRPAVAYALMGGPEPSTYWRELYMPSYDISADFISHDVKWGNTVRVTVERSTAPTRDEAERLLLPAVEQALLRWHGGIYPFDFTRISITERAAARLPKSSDFPPGTQFVIKEFDVPLACVPGRGWFNWYGGQPRPYDVSFLRVDNNWPAESFEEWVGVVKASL